MRTLAQWIAVSTVCDGALHGVMFGEALGLGVITWGQKDDCCELQGSDAGGLANEVSASGI